MTFTQREALYLPYLVAAFMKLDLPPEWGVAIARQESPFLAAAVNNSAGDAKRGGSMGLCQMSLLTARGLGYVGQPTGLLDPVVNAALAAALCKEIVTRLKTRDLADVASAYNSGKPFAKAPQSTRTVYVPRVLAFALAYKERAQDAANKLSLPQPSQLDLPGVSPAAIRGGG